MCGVAGYFLVNQINAANKLAAMSASIEHRGPDDEGYMFANIETLKSQTFASNRSPSTVLAQHPALQTQTAVQMHHLGMAQVRYSIIDLSASGHQPMWSACGNACITFNGEIYNYIELREELTKTGFIFRTQSDTEVLLAGYLTWGDAVLEKLNGFFALAIYDARKKAILLARDRLGKANFYFLRNINRDIYWASEIKALRAAQHFDQSDIDASAVVDFVIFNRRDSGGTFFKSVEDFPPAHYVWLESNHEWSPKSYWQLPQDRWSNTDISLELASSGLADLLTDALQIRLRADVPIAFELSGGMDSSALVGLTAGRLKKKFMACTVEFPQAHSNEEPFARAVADRYPDLIDYRIVKLPHEHFWQSANEFIWLQEEPFHSPNLHTNQSIRRLFKDNGQHVVITGSAGDEMLAGYAGDYLGPLLRNLLKRGRIATFASELVSNTEIPIKQCLAGLVFDALLSDEQKCLLGKWRRGELRLLKRALPAAVMRTPLRMPSQTHESSFHGRTIANMSHRRMNYWLRSGSKSNYGIPIEARAPFLDYRVVEYCCQLPPEYLIHSGWHKFVLREAVKEYLPPEVVWRRQKMGFPFPYREWLTTSKIVAMKNARGIDCPYLHLSQVFKDYDEFVTVAPMTLWRLLSIMLWWRRVIEGREIIAQ